MLSISLGTAPEPRWQQFLYFIKKTGLTGRFMAFLIEHNFYNASKTEKNKQQINFSFKETKVNVPEVTPP